MVAIELYGLRWARALAAAGLVSPDRNRSGSNAHLWNCGQRFLAICSRWCFRHSLQTQPVTYAALVPCFRSSRRVAISAASSTADHSWSVFVRPQTD